MCKQTRKHKCTFKILTCSTQCKYSMETSAVLSLGKLCSEHGYSHEWKNGETPRLTQNGNIITCTLDNFVPLVVPGLSSSSSSSDSLGESDKSSDPVTTRNDKLPCGGSMRAYPDKPALGNRGSANKDEMDKEGPTPGIPDWLQPFTDNLEDLGDACARTFLWKI